MVASTKTTPGYRRCRPSVQSIQNIALALDIKVASMKTRLGVVGHGQIVTCINCAVKTIMGWCASPTKEFSFSWWWGASSAYVTADNTMGQMRCYSASLCSTTCQHHWWLQCTPHMRSSDGCIAGHSGSYTFLIASHVLLQSLLILGNITRIIYNHLFEFECIKDMCICTCVPGMGDENLWQATAAYELKLDKNIISIGASDTSMSRMLNSLSYT